MLIRVSLNTKLVDEAHKLSDFKTKEETVAQAIRDYLARHREGKSQEARSQAKKLSNGKKTLKNIA